jgi:RimJ/RimL family protein N-acetyltransferase
VQLRPIEAADLERVRELRNANSEWFFSAAEISREQQQEWFAQLRARRVRFYVIEEDGRVVGTISVTEGPDWYEVGNLLLDEEYRGQGLMGRALERVLDASGRYYALVKPENLASLEVFRKAAFEPVYVRLERTSTSAA